jgi:hydrogenase maturation protease
MSRKSGVLILGVGNILKKDDGVGVHIVQSLLERRSSLPGNISIIDGGTAGFDLIGEMSEWEKIIIVDALKASDKPGSVYRFKPEQVRTRTMSLSLHEGGIMGVIREMRFLGHNPDIEFVGVVPEDVDTLEIGMSEAVRESIPRAIEVILDAAMN